jgi:hypothetical protein
MVRFKVFHPFNLVGVRTPNKLYNTDDVYEYGFSLDLTTELYFYTYDWGYGLNFRFLGFGLEICKYGV